MSPLRALLPVLCALPVCALTGCGPGADAPSLLSVSQIDPLIATGGPGYRVGASTPAATLPFGMVKIGPDTSDDGGAISAYHCSGYYYDDNEIIGLSHFHLHGTGVPDYGNVLVAPVDGFTPDRIHPDGHRQTFSHDNEEASPGWYAVTLDNGIRAELSATRHAAHHRYAWPEGQDPVLLLDLGWVLFGNALGGEVSFDPETGALEGWTWTQGSFTGGGLKIFFYGVLDGGASAWGTWSDGAISAEQTGPGAASGISVGAWFRPRQQPATLRLALSRTGIEGARRNLNAELPVQDIGTTRAAAEAAWTEALSPVRFHAGEGSTSEQETIFWTALYHALQMPTELGDVDGQYRGFDDQIHPAWDFVYHSDMSLWDTYRTAHPLYNLIYPDKARDFAASLVRMAEQGGAFPRWPAAAGEGGSMLGAPADIVLAETWIKGIRGWGVESAWPRMVDQARGAREFPYNARPGLPWIDRYGWIPADLYGGSVAWLMEMAWADAALGNMAADLGAHEDAAFFAHRAAAWKNVYDPAVGFFHARLSDGSFSPDFTELAWLPEYTEGDAWQYLWLAPHDPEGLAEVLGGRTAALERLEFFFQGLVDEGVLAFPQAYYWHGNEPDIHAAYLFALWGDPDSTIRWVRWIQQNLYHAAPDGLAGNDDGGTLSAWYIFSAMGLFPIAGTDRYVVSMPLFAQMDIDLPGGTFTVRREGPADATHFLRAELDGETIDGPTLRHSQLRGELVVYVE